MNKRQAKKKKNYAFKKLCKKRKLWRKASKFDDLNDVVEMFFEYAERREKTAPCEDIWRKMFSDLEPEVMVIKPEGRK